MSSYAVFLALGLGWGFVLSLWLWRRAGQETETAVLLLCTASPLVILGGKLLHLIEFGKLSTRAAWFDGGYNLYGSFLLVVAFWLVLRWMRPYPLRLFLDCVTPAAAAGLICARIGCYLQGCCAGIPTSFAWGVCYPPGSPAYAAQLREGWLSPSAERSFPVHPTQLYEAAFGAISLALLLWLFRKRTAEGQVFLAGLLWYSAFRFSVDPLRLDAGGWRPFELLSLAQVTSLALATAALIGFHFLARRR